MRRFTFALVTVTFGLISTTAANAGEPALNLTVTPNDPSLNLPPVLAPNDAAAAPVATRQVVINEPQLNVPQQPAQVQQLVIDPSQPNPLAYFSPRLGARFLIQPMFLPQFGNFTAARIVSVPEFGSPLLQLGLEEGDVITRLDGLPVVSLQELERHILETGVRFIRAGEQNVCKGTMFVDPHRLFFDPYSPGCNHNCNNLALRP